MEIKYRNCLVTIEEEELYFSKFFNGKLYTIQKAIGDIKISELKKLLINLDSLDQELFKTFSKNF